MILKYLLITTFSFILSCSNQTKTMNILNNNERVTFLGKWLLISDQDRRCNVCPEVEFLNNGKGKLTKPSKEELKFKYHLYKQKIVFSFEENQNYFDGEDESEFYYKIYDEDDLEILELSSVNNKSKYILARENK